MFITHYLHYQNVWGRRKLGVQKPPGIQSRLEVVHIQDPREVFDDRYYLYVHV